MHERERKSYSVAPLLLLVAISFTPLLGCTHHHPGVLHVGAARR